MAGAAARCPYIVCRQLEAFLADGGDEAWLKGISYTPPKLQRLVELNSLLMLRPWSISRDTIALVADGQGSDAMSAGEMVHAITILASYHCISSVVWGMGVQPEVDLVVRAQAPPSSAEVDLVVRAQAPPSSGADVIPCSATLVLHSRQAVSASSTILHRDASTHSNAVSAAEGTAGAMQPAANSSAECEELVCELLKVTGVPRDQVTSVQANKTSGIHSDMKGGSAAGASGSDDAPLIVSPSWPSVLGDSPVEYRDFHIKEGVFRTRDFSWSEHGYPLLSRYYASATVQVDELFSHTFELTYHTLGSHGNLDTSPYRTAVWFMVHRLFGITNDDYAYSDINRFLKVPTKRYVKRLVTTPWLMTHADYQGIVGGMTDAEKCHINLLSLEAKKQAAVMYALNAVSKFFA
jgi:sestrin